MWPRYGINDGERSNYGSNREIRRDDIYIYSIIQQFANWKTTIEL
jgi:hypothetical protein